MWKRAIIHEAAAIRDAIAAIDGSSMQIALVTDDAGHLLGTVTDGDIRRAILRGVDLAAPARSVMNTEPTVARVGEGQAEMLARMKARQLHQMPVLDAAGRVVGLETIDRLIGGAGLDNWVVLMAGGLGRRLRPLTEQTPKPMLAVGDKPLIQTILENFLAQDFRRFYISVNYKAGLIKDHFGDGSAWNAEIRYLHEDRELGTAGALSLIEETPTAPLFVMNADLLTNVNFRSLLAFHAEQGAKATMCVREYDMEVPFGVVNLEDERMVGIDEKPVHRFLVNAGIYLLEPELLGLIPRGERFDIPDLFGRLLEAGHHTAVFPIREYWLDVGRLDEYHAANGEFAKLFK